jgi:hypothetical protein
MIESERNFVSEPEKPPVLFHASRNPNVEIFEPRALKMRDKNEGPRVFATPSRAMASIFLVETDDSWTQSGAFNGIPFMIISDEERFKNLDKGGVIYSLPNNTFENDPEKGLGELEWTSNKSVTPISKEFIPSALQDMLQNGVKVYFVDKITFNQIQNSPDNGELIIKSLIPFSI